MTRYLTGLISTDYWRFEPFPYKALNWSLDLVSTSASVRHLESPQFSSGEARKYEGREVVINAKDSARAEQAAFLIQASMDALSGSSFFPHPRDMPELCPMDEIDVGVDDEAGQAQTRASATCRDISIACRLAVKVSRRLQRVYSLSKLWLSYQVFSIPGVYLDPSYTPALPKSSLSYVHVGYAYAVVLAYAAIEELGLDVRASKENPARIKGRWNPKVRDDLESRLKRAGVDLAERFSWNLRGPRTLLEKERPPDVVARAPWARWDVRDGDVEVVDAIAHVSWLRSKVAAHKSKPGFMNVLSVYEVSNAQYLARRLLLEACGFWRIWSKYYG